MLKIEKISSSVKVKEQKLSSTKSRYTLEPMYRGYGHTLGNMMRRVLLSSMPGSAIKGVKIGGVVSEFSTIDGVRENVVDITLNLRGLIIKAQNFEDCKAKLKFQGPGEVKASDIETDGTFEILNKDHVIANVSKNITLEMEFLIGCGEGFVTADENHTDDWPVDFLAIDSLYSPVINVSYRVEDAMVGRITNFDRLILDVETNGSVETKDVMSYAVELINKHLAPLADVGNRMEHLREEIEEEEAWIEEDPLQNATPDVRLEDLDLSVRSYNCLKKKGIDSLKMLGKLTHKELLKIKNLGKSSLNEILDKLREHNMEPRREEEDK